MSLIGKIILKFMGYEIDKSFIEGMKNQHIIIFPHTSKIEAFIITMSLLATNNIDNTCFFCTEYFMNVPLLSKYLESFNAIWVKKGTGMTNIAIEYLKNSNKSFAISPEGGLEFNEWKKGFFIIARETQIPIIVGGINFNNHKIYLDNHLIKINKDEKYEDRVDEIKEKFANSGIIPLYPECSNPIIVNSLNKRTSYLPISRYLILLFILYYKICH